MKVVGAIAAVAAIFGTAVLVAEGFSGDGGHGGEHAALNGMEHGAATTGVRGLGASSNGVTLELETARVQPGARSLRFSIVGADDSPVQVFEVEHTKRMHLIVARRDLTGFQHLHPELGADGRWSTPLTIDEPGAYRVFADFKRGGENVTLAEDLTVEGSAAQRELPPAWNTATTADGYEVELRAAASRAGRPSELAFTVTRDGDAVATEPYLGAGGHLVALREGDLAFLHVHPVGDNGTDVKFETEFPTAGSYRLFLQFKPEGKVQTAAFTRRVAR